MDTVHINGDSDDFSLSRLFDEVKVTSGSTSQTLEAVEFVSFNDQTIELLELLAALSTPFDVDEATENKVTENVGIGTTLVLRSMRRPLILQTSKLDFAG